MLVDCGSGESEAVKLVDPFTVADAPPLRMLVRVKMSEADAAALCVVILALVAAVPAAPPIVPFHPPQMPTSSPLRLLIEPVSRAPEAVSDAVL